MEKGTELLESYKKELERIERQRETCRRLEQNTSKLKNKSRLYRGIIKRLEATVEEVNKLKTNTYYSACISTGQASHNVILYVRHKIRCSYI